MLESISGAVKDERIYLFLDGASIHKTDPVKKRMKELNIEPVFNVGYRFEYNPCERLFGQLKLHYRRVLLEKMLEGAHPKSTPLKDSLHITLCAKAEQVKTTIPKFIKKSLGILRRDANEIRRKNGFDELRDDE